MEQRLNLSSNKIIKNIVIDVKTVHASSLELMVVSSVRHAPGDFYSSVMLPLRPTEQETIEGIRKSVNELIDMMYSCDWLIRLDKEW